jgi:hypothetical protein
VTGIPWPSWWGFWPDHFSVLLGMFSDCFLVSLPNLSYHCAFYFNILLIRTWCLCRHELTHTTKFYMHGMQIKGMPLSSGYCRQAVSLIGMFGLCCWGQILSNLNTRHLGNLKWISSQLGQWETWPTLSLFLSGKSPTWVSYCGELGF